jgi:DMSO/TMAO reductase YedYZ molybdopterin-dependent catalytic subunit
MAEAKDSLVSLRMFFIYALLGGFVATAAAYAGAILLELPYPPEEIMRLMIAPLPGFVQSVVIETLLEYAKYIAFVFASIIYSAIYGLVGVLVGVLFRKNFQRNIGRSIILATGVTTLMGIALVELLTTATSGFSSPQRWAMVVPFLLGVNVAYAGISVFQARLEWVSTLLTLPPYRSRRDLIKKAVIAAAVLIIAVGASKILTTILMGQPIVQRSTSIPVNSQPENVEPNLPPVFRDPRLGVLVGSEVTDNRVFYRVDIGTIPDIDPDNWSLKISGKINNPLTYNKDTFLALTSKEQYATLECISNTINPPGALISNTKWIGVPLATILNQAGLTSDAKFVVFLCADGYTVGIPLEHAMQPGALLAYMMGGETLRPDHGFPLRAIVPGSYGMMNAKWIVEIEVTDHPYLGYWQQRGWSNDARVKTTAIIYYPPPRVQSTEMLPIAGVAFAGDRGISKVEVSTDGGNTWSSATLKKPKSPYSWVLWAYEWTATRKGTYTILARATDGNGFLQDPKSAQTFPDGASGYHSTQVTVT